jgi:cyclophilin family peptidyl-prolyl cis-trans isomerase
MLKLRMLILLTMLGLGLTSSARADYLIRFRTVLGDMDVQLFSNDKPVTVSNFLKYVKSGRYDNMFLHRCVTNFVVQGGGYTVKYTNSPEGISGSGLYYVTTYGNITNEYNVGRTFSNVYGTLAMAKVAGDPNSASSHWFFNLADNSSYPNYLDTNNGGYTVFGRVIGGTNILDKFNHLPANGGDIINLYSWYPVSWAKALTTLPLSKTATSLPPYADLIYPVIELLEAKIAVNSFGERVVTWASAANRINIVEYADTLPATWNTLYTVFGTGSDMNFTDTELSVKRRFYRIKISY